MDLYDCDLSCRTYSCLAKSNIHTTEDLCNMTENQLIKIRNLGRMSVEEIIYLMKNKGLKFREDNELN